MSTFASEWDLEQLPNHSPSAPVVAVVGYDGSEPSRRALNSAATMLRGRNGRLEVVYVAAVPGIASVSGSAVAEIENSFDEVGRELIDEIAARLGDNELPWHFQRRDGSVAHELLAAADELRSLHGAGANIVIVVGGSAHKYHRLLGSAALNVVRHDRFPVVVVP